MAPLFIGVKHMLEEMKKKYPMNSRGMTVIPCMSLTPDNIQDWMIGLRVSVGLNEPGVTTDQGTLEGYDDASMWVRIGQKRKKLAYDPADIQLCVYQFDNKILFSNETAVRRENKKELSEEPIDKQPPKIDTAKANPKKKPSNPKSLFGM